MADPKSFGVLKVCISPQELSSKLSELVVDSDISLQLFKDCLRLADYVGSQVRPF